MLIAAASFAIMSWPADERVTAATDIAGVHISANGRNPHGEEVAFTPGKDGGTIVDVIVHFDAATGLVSVEADTDVDLPNSYAAACRALIGRCTPACSVVAVTGATPGTCVSARGVTVVARGSGRITDIFGKPLPGPPSSFYEAKFYIPAINGAGYPFAQSSGHANVIIPAVDVRHNEASWGSGGIAVPEFNPVGDFEMCLPTAMAGFEWTYGEIPTYFAPGADPHCTLAIWDPSAAKNSYATEGTASAELPLQLNTDDRDALFSGVALGAVAAALLAIITDLLRPWSVPVQQSTGVEAALGGLGGPGVLPSRRIQSFRAARVRQRQYRDRPHR